MDLYNPLSQEERREISGLIYKDADGKFHATPGMRGRRDGASSSPYSAAALVPKGAKVTGMYHTHAHWTVDGIDKGIDWNETFSREGTPGDIALAHKAIPQDTGLVGRIEASYLATPSGRMLEYNVRLQQISQVGSVRFLPQYSGMPRTDY